MDDAVFVQDVDGRSDLFAVEPDDVLLQPQSGHLLQGALVTVLHEDVHLLLWGNMNDLYKLPPCGPCEAWTDINTRLLPDGAQLQSIAQGLDV